jgi:Nif-specific regulatory protein
MSEKTVNPKPDEIQCLYEITKAIHGTLDLRKALYKVLDLLEEYLGMSRGSISLLNHETGEIHIEVAHGISSTAKTKGRYKLGEGITGRVIETGRPMAVPRLNEEPLFLDRTGSRSNIDKSKIAFFCVPIKDSNHVIGSLSVDRLFEETESPDEDVRLLSIISILIAQKVAMLEQINKEKEQLNTENIRLKKELGKKYSFSNIIGNSHKMQEVFHLISQVAKSNANVLLLGESGTGKELVANAIHYNSLRTSNPFIKVNCAALPGNLVEAELFGYMKGAFTGASMQKAGKFELANNGTIFLDEIGSLLLESQGKLLRVIQERSFERVGGHRLISVDVRIIASTNRDLKKETDAGRFRQDLFYRLNVFPIKLPSLSERGEAILPLAEYFLARYSTEFGKKTTRFTDEARNLLVSYHWPGNIRELQNVIERAVILAENEIDAMHLKLDAEVSSGHQEKYLKSVEKDTIVKILSETGGNRKKAADRLGISLRTLQYRIKEYGL